MEKAEKEKPDLILLDLFLPQVKGFEVCKRLKERASTKDIPVIILTGAGTEHLDDQCEYAGATGYLKKPYSKADLIKKIKTVLKDQ